MRRWGTWIVWIGGVAWALLTFFASNSPSDVQQRATGWLALPILRDIPDKLIAFVASPFVFAFTFFTFGAFAGWRLNLWMAKGGVSHWAQSLGSDMSSLAYDIRDISAFADINRINADLDVVRVKLEQRGFIFPKMSDGFNTAQSLFPYLTRVSAHLKAGNIAHAKLTAQQFASNPIP